MKKLINFKGVKILKKGEQKLINGGGCIFNHHRCLIGSAIVGAAGFFVGGVTQYVDCMESYGCWFE